MKREQERELSKFHDGERTVQQLLGVRGRAEQIGQFGIRDFMPEQHRDFFASLPFVLVGSLDAQGQPWASVLSGAPGFLSSLSAQQLDVHAVPLAGDPLAHNLHAHAALGLLGIQLETRRRNRLNGRIVSASSGGFSLRVDQSFGNCPKYINAREPHWQDGVAAEPVQTEGASLSERGRALIATSDTCFIASASAPDPTLTDEREVVDVSHRGGKPGFVRVDEQPRGTVLTMPDFSGNNMYNTLGNLTVHPRAGLLFIDFASGDLLQLACSSEIVYEGDEVDSFAGAERIVRLSVHGGLLFPRAFPFRFAQVEPASQLRHTGDWTS